MRRCSSPCALICLLLVSGCTNTLQDSNSAGNSAEHEPESFASAESTLEALRNNETINIKDSSRRYTVDGELHHIRAQIGDSNELSRTAGILQDGEPGAGNILVLHMPTR
jgi:hypothetical protein